MVAMFVWWWVGGEGRGRRLTDQVMMYCMCSLRMLICVCPPSGQPPFGVHSASSTKHHANGARKRLINTHTHAHVHCHFAAAAMVDSPSTTSMRIGLVFRASESACVRKQSGVRVCVRVCADVCDTRVQTQTRSRSLTRCLSSRACRSFCDCEFFFFFFFLVCLVQP